MGSRLCSHFPTTHFSVTTGDNGFKILANVVGLRSFRAIEVQSFEALRSPIESTTDKVSGSLAITNVNPVNCKVEKSSSVRPSPILNGVDLMGRSMDKKIYVEDVTDITKLWQLSEIVGVVQCRLVTMPNSTDSSSKVVRLLYTNSGVGVLALGANGVQKLWKWTRNEQNPKWKGHHQCCSESLATKQCLLMTDYVSGVNLEEAVMCIALSNNDSYVMPTCGGKVSLFNMMTFKVMTTFKPPPPASTVLTFHPQYNSIIAIGMEDLTIHIYNVSVDEVKSKLRGHQKWITGLDFLTNLNILFYLGTNAQLCVWSIDRWEKRKQL
ncbi:topless-related protein 3-like [Juglans microcarpa x Juglans regia]|uniref:topless-related protein 3-like n=1 Tax=Juglans microcarpa x Juglans regia TaxID=2249226 RepID=UPI001B7EE643|nr:topless-related protein 3-like [Juglans microcarpa x Juglans regia]